MGAVKQWLAEIEEKTAEMLVTIGAGKLDIHKAQEMVDYEMQRVEYDCTRFDVNALIDEAFGEGEDRRHDWLEEMHRRFDSYMNASMWDHVGSDGVCADDAWEAIGAFVEFCTHDRVCDVNGNTLFKDALGVAHDFDAAIRLMDEDLQEKLANEMCPCNPQEFIERYAKEHEEKFGEGFAPYDGGVW